MTLDALSRPPALVQLNDLLHDRRLGQARLATSLTLSYLTHVLLMLAILMAARQSARTTSGIQSWGSGDSINVTALYEPAAATDPGPVAAPAPAPRRKPTRRSDAKPAWKAPPLEPRRLVVREVDEQVERAKAAPRTDVEAGSAAEDVVAAPDGQEDASGEDSSLPEARRSALPQGRFSGGVSGLGRPGLIDAWYVMRVRDIIYSNWASPFRRTGSDLDQLEVVVFFRIRKDGAILSDDVERPSGMTDFDRAGLRAVRNSRLPPLPPRYPGNTLGVHYSFKLEPGQ